MQTVLIVLHLMIVVALVVVVLLQRSEGGALGMGGGGGGGGFLTGRGTANVLTRTTALLAACFFLTSIVLAILAGRGDTGRSVIDTLAPAVNAPAPAQPVSPAGPGGGGVLDQLRQQGGGQAPAPAGPQVPQSQ